MSDTGLNASLVLDINSALSSIGQIEQALDAITNVTLTADTSAITSAIDSAVDASDGTVTAEADTVGVTSAIDTAIDAASGDVDIDADTAGVTSAIDTAVDGADGAVDIDADTAGIASAIDTAVDAADSAVDVEGDAAGVTSSIDSAVDAADSDVTVEGDAGGVTSSIDSAVDAADSAVTVEGDAGGVTGAIDQAVDAADSSVNVEGDAGSVTGAIDSAVAAANTNVRVTADSQGLDGLRSELRSLEQQGQSTGQNITLSVRTAVQATLGVLSGLFISTGVAYNSLIQRTQAAFTTLLGSTDLARRQLSELEEFASTSPFPRQAFIEATQTLLAFGTAAEDVVPTLGAIQDAVAASGQSADAIGEITFILSQITSTGKITAETLNQLGFRGINAAKLIGDQMGLTEAQIRDSITAGSLDAGEALDALVAGMEENFGGAADNVKDTWEGAIDRIKGALRDLSSAIVDPFISKEGGGAAVDFANNLADALRNLEAGIVPVAAQLSGAFAEVLDALGTDLLPAVVEAVVAAAPAFGSFSSVISALAPVISALATVIEAIPTPLLTMATAALAFRSVAGPLVTVVSNLSSAAVGMVGSFRGAEGGFSASSAGAGKLRTALAGVNVALAGATIAFAAYSWAQSQNAAAAAQVAAQGTAIADGLRSADGAVTGLTESLNELADAGDKIAGPSSGFAQMASTDLGTALREAGITTSEFIDIVREGPEAFTDWRVAQVEARNMSLDSSQALAQLGEQVAEEAEARARGGVETEAWTESQLRAAEAANQTRDGTVDYIGVVEQLEEASQAATAAANEQAEALDAQQQALADLATTAPEVALGFEAIAGGADIGVTGLGQFAVAAQEASLSGDALDAMAAQFGTTAPELAAAIEQVAGVITGLRDATLSTLPSLSDIAGAADEFSLSGFRDELQSAYEAILGFNDNLGLIAEAGFPRLAAAAATLGPEYTATIAQGLRDGETDIAAAAELSLEGIENAGVDTENLITGEIGPNLAAATGEMGALASLTFGENFTIDAEGQIVLLEGQLEGARPNIRQVSEGVGTSGAEGFDSGFTPSASGGITGAESEISASAGGLRVAGSAAGAAGKAGFELGFTPNPVPGISGATTGISGSAGGLRVAGGTAGTGGKAGFETGFKPNPSPAMEAARALVRQAGPAVQRASGDVGRDAVFGFQAGIGPIGGRARQAAAQIGPAVASAGGGAYAAGRGVGAQLGSGIVAGINSYVGSIRAAASAAVSAATSAARAAAAISSPSKVWTEIGEQMGDGLALGLEASRSAVTAASVDLATAAADMAVGVGPIDTSRFAAAGAAAGPVVVHVAPGAVRIDASGDPGYDGRVAADALVGAIPGAMQRARFTARVG